MKKFKSYLNNEQGNIALFVIGLLSVMIILFVLILNLAGALIVKEQAISTSQQAALAATASLYEDLPDFISDYETKLKEMLAEEAEEEGGETEPPEEAAPEEEEDTIAELIEKEVNNLSGEMAEYSLNEIQNEAIDRVLSSEMDKGLGGGLLKKMLNDEMEYRWINSMKESARNTILANGGELAGAQMTVFDNGQVVVKSSKEASAIGYNGFFAGAVKNLTKSSKGPEILFVQKLAGWEGRTYSLE
ncbi:Tad domain-containing protein [Planococcus ruber]|uniref:Tad domain-containing protein n=1 Tax=Planococcus ruber TaxID=2027871 RepID=UPI001FEDD396|nr:Tad domain-containing protein [Planococcus ruber]MCJ1908052.1 Tad domain-containing protein [Planococcus ruber]